MTARSLKGCLLVASPALRDPNFDRTVVLVIEHGDEGAVGVVLNRPSEIAVAGAAPELGALAADPPVVFVGGPVAPGAAICLARASSTGAGEAWKPLLGPVGLLDLGGDGEEAFRGVEQVRVFSGYAGWGPGQLEDEVAAGAWFVVRSQPADALSADAGNLWRIVLRRQRGPLALLASFPEDPSLN